MMNLVTCPLHQTASFAAEANFHRGAILSKWTPLSSFFLVNPQPLVEGSSLYISPYRLLAMDVWNVLPNAYASVFRSPLQHFMPPTKWNFLFSRKALKKPKCQSLLFIDKEMLISTLNLSSMIQSAYRPFKKTSGRTIAFARFS